MTLTDSEFFLDVLYLLVATNQDASLKHLVETVVQLYHEETKDKHQIDGEEAALYIEILEEILNSDVNLADKTERKSLLLKYKKRVNKHHVDESHLQNILDTVADANAPAQRRINYITKKIRNWIIWTKGNRTLRKMFAKSRKCETVRDQTSQDQLLNEMLSQAKELVQSFEETSARRVDDPVEMIDMSDPESIRHAFTSFKSKRSSNVLKTGLQGLNRMFGFNGGIVRGEFLAFAALSHHYKSGILMDLARWFATLNNPNITSTEIPTIVFISLENEIYENLNTWFRRAYSNAYNASGDELSDEEIVKYVSEVYAKRGFRLLVFRKIGEYFGYREFIKMQTDLKNAGYYVVATIIDYVTLMQLDESGHNEPKKLQILGQKLGNFANHSGMTIATGLQLSGMAEMMAVDGRDIVKKYNASHLADCKGLKRELDFLAFMHIEVVNERSYLTFCWNKHRYDENTPRDHRYVAYRFGKYGILDDVYGADRSIKDIHNDDSPDESSVIVDDSVTF